MIKLETIREAEPPVPDRRNLPQVILHSPAESGGVAASEALSCRSKGKASVLPLHDPHNEEERLADDEG